MKLRKEWQRPKKCGGQDGEEREERDARREGFSLLRAEDPMRAKPMSAIGSWYAGRLARVTDQSSLLGSQRDDRRVILPCSNASEAPPGFLCRSSTAVSRDLASRSRSRRALLQNINLDDALSVLSSIGAESSAGLSSPSPTSPSFSLHGPWQPSRYHRHAANTSRNRKQVLGHHPK